MDLYTEHQGELNLVAIGAVAALLAPKALQLPHYTYATLQNIYLDLKYLGLAGTLKCRSNLTPRKATVQAGVNFAWDTMRLIPIPALQR